MDSLPASSQFRRDPASNALINADLVGLGAYKARKAQSKKVEEIAEDINSFKAELDQIKALLKQLINNKE